MSTPDRRDSRSAPTWVKALVFLQLLVPTVALVMDPPTRFGFQMYSGLGGLRLEVHDVEGTELDLPDDLLPGAYRHDLPWVEHLPEHVCRRLPAAVSVTIEHDDRSRTLPCADL